MLPILKRTLLALVLASAAGATANALAVIGADNYQFREPPLNSMGVKSMAELRGKPIVIDFWGRN